jgi:hypothetical protein
VGKDVSDKDYLAVEEDLSDQSILVSTDIEHGETFNIIRSTMVVTNVGEVPPFGTRGGLEPRAQRSFGIGVLSPELPKLLA